MIIKVEFTYKNKKAIVNPFAYTYKELCKYFKKKFNYKEESEVIITDIKVQKADFSFAEKSLKEIFVDFEQNLLEFESFYIWLENGDLNRVIVMQHLKGGIYDSEDFYDNYEDYIVGDEEILKNIVRVKLGISKAIEKYFNWDKLMKDIESENYDFYINVDMATFQDNGKTWFMITM